MLCYNPAPVRLSVKELGDERDGVENTRISEWGTEKRLSNEKRATLVELHIWHTHTQIQSSLRSKMWSSPFISLCLSSPNVVPPFWHLMSFTPSFCLLNTILSLWFCLNLSRMHLDISTPGRIGEIEGVRVLESETNREWLSERKSHWGIERDDRWTKVEREKGTNSKWGTKVLFTHSTAKHAPTHTCTQSSDTLSFKGEDRICV